MSKGILKLVWIVPVFFFGVFEIFGGVIKAIIAWIKERKEE